MPILECNQLSKSYGKVPALDGVSFAIEPGRIVGLLGPTGSGKTTLIKLARPPAERPMQWSAICRSAPPSLPG